MAVVIRMFSSLRFEFAEICGDLLAMMPPAVALLVAIYMIYLLSNR